MSRLTQFLGQPVNEQCRDRGTHAAMQHRQVLNPRRAHSNYKSNLSENLVADFCSEPVFSSRIAYPALLDHVFVASAHPFHVAGLNNDRLNDHLAILVSNEFGLIRHCNRYCGLLLGRSPASLISEPVSQVLPKLGEIDLISNNRINPYLKFLARIGHQFEAMGARGIHFKCELFLVFKTEQEVNYLQIVIRPITMLNNSN